MVDMVLVDGFLETLQDRVGADAPVDGLPGFLREFIQQRALVVFVKCIHDLICESNKTVNIVDRRSQVLMQEANGAAERSAVSLCRSLAAFPADVIIKVHHTVFI